MARAKSARRPTRAAATKRAKPVEPVPPGDHSPAPPTPEALHGWIAEHLDIHIAQDSLIDGHAAPFDYLVHAFFEGRYRRGPSGWALAAADSPRSPDCVVWANRGGGKTFLGALATLLDMVFKPGVQVRILAGSLEQSGHMHEHLRGFFELPAFAPMVRGAVTSRRIVLTNGSRVQVLSASERSVRGTRVNKVRCDEVDLFDRQIWNAAQLTTRSKRLPGPWGDSVSGAVEALSTMQNPYGLMWGLVTDRHGAGTDTVRAGAPPRALFRWGVVDALEHCPPERPCDRCGLHDDCAGRAKLRPPDRAGHLAVDDALAQKARVDRQTWKSEMLCLRPARSDTVYPEFETDLHVLDEGDARLRARAPIAYFAGMDFGWRSETVVLLASLDAAGTLVVEREHAAARLTINDHVAMIRSWVDQGATDALNPVLDPRRGIEWISIDPAGAATNDQTARSNAALLRAAGFTVRVRRHAVRDGLRLVRARLAPALAIDPDQRPADGQAPPPRLFVHARCRRLIECLQRYRYTGAEQSAEPDKREGFDHACDALRYLVVGLDLHHPVRRRDY
ncbi:MAG: hypothetical protein ACK4WH_12690 [Phycisphaerales bacterium]